MPRLDAGTAEKVANAEDGFKPVDPGVYVAYLAEDVTEKQGQKGFYWRWVFVIDELDNEGNPQQFAGRKLFTNTSLSDAAWFKLKEMFAAFGVPTESEANELVGQKVRLQVKTVVIQQGNRKGEVGNEVAKALPLAGPVGVGIDGSGEAVEGAAPAVSTVKTDKKPEKPLY